MFDVRQNRSRTWVETIEQEADRRVTLALEAQSRRAADAHLVLLDDARVGHQSSRETGSIPFRISR
jgi:hypothetical protein